MGATPDKVVVPEGQGDRGQGDQGKKEHVSAMPKVQVESGSIGAEKEVEQQPKRGVAPQERGSGRSMPSTMLPQCLGGWREKKAQPGQL